MENKLSSDVLQVTSVESERPIKRETEQEFQDAHVILPPDGGWGWMVVFAAFTTFVMVDGIIYSFGVFLEKMSDDLMCSKTKVSTTVAILTGVFCLSGPFAASLVNNFGYRIVGVAGSVISILSCLATSLSKSIYLIYFTYGLMAGIGFGMVYMPAVIAVGFYFERWRGIATGIATCGAGMGGVALPLLLSFLLERLGWRHTFRVLSALLLLTTLCAAAFRPIAPTCVRRVKVNAVETGNFFATYHNRMYPTLSEVTEVPTITLLQPRKLNKSSEIMIMTYPSSSLKCKNKDEEAVEESAPKQSQARDVEKTGSEVHRGRDKSPRHSKQVSTLFVAKKRQRKIPLHEARTYFATPMRPLYRDDIFFDSSFNFLQRYKKTDKHGSQKSAVTFSKSNMEYHMSVTRVATSRDVEHAEKFNLCTEAVKRSLATMLDYKLLKSPSFMLIALNSAFVCLGYFTTYIFIKDRAGQTGVPETTTFWLISIIGLANTIGRIGCGVVATCRRIEYSRVSAFCLSVGGVATILSVHFNQVSAQVCYAVIFGSFVACISALRTLIIVDTLGLDMLTNAVGLILMFQGVAALSGILIAGLLRDATGDYKSSFYFSGTMIIIGALFYLPLKRVAKWENFKGRNLKQRQK